MPHLYTMQTTQWRQCRAAALPHCRAIEYFPKNTWTFNNSLYLCNHETSSDIPPVHLDHQHAQGL